MTTIDLHDIAAILLHEYMLSEVRFKHALLREVNDRSAPRNALPPHIPLPGLDNIPYDTPVTGYFLLDDGTVDENTPAVQLSAFKHPEFVNNTSMNISDAQLEKIYWGCKHHDSSYSLAHAMQMVLDSLPSFVQLRIRTSQGHTITIPRNAFVIAELNILANSATYICKITNEPHLGPDKVGIEQYQTGSDGPFPWVYMVFGGEDVANVDLDQDRRVALDLVSPLLGMRGLGGEIFAMERTEDYHSKLLPTVATELGDITLSERIVPGSSGRRVEDEKAIALSRRVLARLEKVMSGEEVFCAYCGKEGPESRCSGCGKDKYCDKGCQAKAWKYHKRWCK